MLTTGYSGAPSRAAHASDEDRAEGLSVGMDAYLCGLPPPSRSAMRSGRLLQRRGAERIPPLPLCFAGIPVSFCWGPHRLLPSLLSQG